MKDVLTVLAALGVTAMPVFADAPDTDAAQTKQMPTITAPDGPGVDALGDQTFGPIDLDALSGQTGNLGVAYLNGEYHCSYRAIPPDGSRANEVMRLDSSGALIGTYDQISGAFGDSWGYRDGFTDGTSVYFGWAGGIAKHDADGSNGTLFIAGGPPSFGTWRALAYDPAGDGGNGSIYAADFGSDIIEVTMAGALIRTLPNLDGWSLYGLDVDPCTGNLWGHTALMEVWEIDTVTGRFTGTSFTTDPFAAAQGGLSGVPGGAGGSGNFYDLAAVAQSTPDNLGGYEVYVDDCGGGEFALEISGTCPGRVTANVSGATAGGLVALVFSPNRGNCVIPSGPCAGTTLGLSCNGIREVARGTADANGDVSFSGNAPSAACGGFVQAVDVSTCDTSNVEQL